MERLKKMREFVLCPVQAVLCKQTASRAELDQFNFLRTSQHSPHFFKLTRQQSSEDRMYVARGIEISAFTEPLHVSGVVAKFGVVEAQLHIPRKGNRSQLANFFFDFVAQRIHISFSRRSA